MLNCQLVCEGHFPRLCSSHLRRPRAYRFSRGPRANALGSPTAAAFSQPLSAKQAATCLVRRMALSSRARAQLHRLIRHTRTHLISSISIAGVTAMKIGSPSASPAEGRLRFSVLMTNSSAARNERAQCLGRSRKLNAVLHATHSSLILSLWEHATRDSG